MERMKPTAYKIGEGERKGLSKDMQEVILAYEEENKKLEEELKERNKLIRDIVLNFHRIDENKILELILKLPTE